MTPMRRGWTSLSDLHIRQGAPGLEKLLRINHAASSILYVLPVVSPSPPTVTIGRPAGLRSCPIEDATIC